VKVPQSFGGAGVDLVEATAQYRIKTISGGALLGTGGANRPLTLGSIISTVEAAGIHTDGCARWCGGRKGVEVVNGVEGFGSFEF